MADPVALTSIISSAALAGISFWFNYRTGKEQRAHEAQQGFEARVWETKSQALFETIAASRKLSQRIVEHGTGREVVFAISDAKEVLDELVAPVEAYASNDCRNAFSNLHRLLRRSGVPAHMSEERTSAHARKVEAIDAEDFDETVAARKSEKYLLDMGLFLPAVGA